MLISEKWIKKHKHNLDGWIPKIEIIRPGSKQTFIIKNEQAMKEVSKILRQSKKEGRDGNGS